MQLSDFLEVTGTGNVVLIYGHYGTSYGIKFFMKLDNGQYLSAPYFLVLI